MTTPTNPPDRKDGCRAIMGDKWAILIVSDLGAGPRRFTELKRGIDGISQRMLTVTLRSLERDGLVTRTVHNVMPPNISYGLTPMGLSLLEAATPLLEWGNGHLPRINAARATYDDRAATEIDRGKTTSPKQ
ncbi:helix-turn-helix domain-containing protein [Actinoplanes sp. TFC3]|uniref:winged helix-turn-helix transcriptional regulator n=1 Tax=Actinoplanes sp. TFC3 TaxID=1710355 RepID=UPI00082CCAC2|nr:helix-turn-helix domain-containing protein [Actinoplanes sp. TFC3]